MKTSLGGREMTPPDRKTVSALASLRDELLESNWAYWHDDAAIVWLNDLLGDAFPPWTPPELR